jgi:ribosome-associated heat shock protein Hsp15
MNGEARTGDDGGAAGGAGAQRVRLDRWLWAARFFKTRSAAAQAVDGGKVDVDGQRAKRARLVQAGDRIMIRRPPFQHEVIVRGVSELRGSAKVAATLFQETPESQSAREALVYQLKTAPGPAFTGKGRPTKRDRRVIERMRLR